MIVWPTLLLAVLLQPAPAQQAPPPPRGSDGSATIVLQLHDPKSNLKGPPRVRLGALDGQTLLPVDDGTGADPHANDRVFSVSLDGWDGTTTSFEVSDGKTTWKARGKHEGGTWIWVRIHNERTMQIGEGTPEVSGPVDGEEGRPPASDQGALIGPVSETVWAVTAALWALVAASLSAGLGLGMALVVRGGPRAAAILGAEASPVPSRLLAPSELEPTLQALGSRRLLLIGPPPPSLPPALQPLVIADGALPEEILAAARELALVDGAPLALLVTDPRSMDQPAGSPALDRLLTLVGARFPVLVLEQVQVQVQVQPAPGSEG